MSEYSNLYLQQINVAVYGITLNQIQKADLLQKYELLASVMTNTSDKSVIENNSANFSILFNKVLFLSVLGTTPRNELLEYKELHTMLTIIDSKMPESTYTQKLEKMHESIENKLRSLGYSTLNDQSIESIENALSTFGLEETDVDDPDNIEVEDDENLVDIDIDSLFDEDENEADEEITENEKEEPLDDETKKEEVSKLFKAFIDNNVDVLTNALSAIYESGFSAIPHAGILINNGSNSPLIRLKESIKPGTFNNMISVPDEGTAYDYMIMKILYSEIPGLSKYAALEDGKNAIPNINILLNDTMVCLALHLQFQSANIDYCTGITSIRKWITEEKLNDSKSGTKYENAEDWIKRKNNGRKRLCSFKDVRDWYRWSLKRIIVESLIEAGVKSLEDMDKAKNVMAAITRNVKNIVVVSDRAVGEQEEIKICTDSSIDVDKIIDSLTREINTSNTNAIQIKQIAKESFEKDNVLTLSIIYNKDKASNSDLFAHEIVNRLAEAGSLPSWGNALLGKKEDGTYLFWKDFMGSAEPSKRNYTIYAGSRSGKGVMTSTLVASAMCDSKHVFYTDGKPENGACLGEIAWSEGKEAYVFDGQASGKKPYSGYMEQYTNSVREVGEVAAYIEKCPECLFANKSYFTTELQQKFLGVMRYLKSLQLCAEIASKRADGKLPMDDWQVWIFDEMTDMSNNEKQIRAAFARYVRNKTGAKDLSEEDASYYKIEFAKMKPEQVDPSSDKYDSGLDYIRKWVKWTSGIRHVASNLSTISMGKANMNLIFIFQEATWIQEAKKITTIGKVVNALKCTKIVGRNALANACGEYGEGATQKADWYKKIQDGDGWWAISNGADIRTSSVTLFKPYKVWTTPLNSEGEKDPNGNPDDQKYLGGYIKNLLSKAGINPADLLQESFNYANEAVVSLGYASSLKEYIYDCTNFAIDSSGVTYDILHNEYDGNNDNINSSGTSVDSLNISDEEEINFGRMQSNNKMTDDELLDTAYYILSTCETDALGQQEIDYFAKMIVELLRAWGW